MNEEKGTNGSNHNKNGEVIMMRKATCLNCGSMFKWKAPKDDDRIPDCPTCYYNNQTGKTNYPEGSIEKQYRAMARMYILEYGPLERVEYLSHFPNFEINFVFKKGTVYSGRRTGRYDINFLTLGYYGEGPRYARAFLDEAGFPMTYEVISTIKPKDVIALEDGKVVINGVERRVRPHLL
jgi:hypothetical protein